MQGFEAKKRLLRVYFSPVPYTPYSSIPRNRNPSANRNRVWWLESEHNNHYNVLLATMQWQNVVFKPNAWEKGNTGLRFYAAADVTFAWLASTPTEKCKIRPRLQAPLLWLRVLLRHNFFDLLCPPLEKTFRISYYTGPPIMLTPAPINFKI